MYWTLVHSGKILPSFPELWLLWYRCFPTIHSVFKMTISFMTWTERQLWKARTSEPLISPTNPWYHYKILGEFYKRSPQVFLDRVFGSQENVAKMRVSKTPSCPPKFQLFCLRWYRLAQYTNRRVSSWKNDWWRPIEKILKIDWVMP